MHPSEIPSFHLTETSWRGILSVLSAAVILFTVWCLTHGITTIFMHLYYFPIVLLAYHYRWKGCGLATLLAFAYLGLSIIFSAGQGEIILGALYRVLVFIGIAVVIAYLSDRLVKTRDSLQMSAEIRERYLSLAPAIILVLDRNGAITLLNEKGCGILSCTFEEVRGKSWFDTFIPEHERGQVRTVFSQIMRGHLTPFGLNENEVVTGTGAVKTIRWYNSLLHDAAGEITGTLSYGEDITDEKQAQDSLRRMQQFQESVITNANVWISVLAPDGSTLLVWNDAAETISGYKKSDALGKKTIWKQLYPDNDYRKKVTADIRRIIGQDEFLENFETEIRCADGSKKTVVWNTRSLRDTKGTVTGYIAIGRDVTAQKSAESRAGESSRFLGTMIDTLPMPIFFKDAEGRYIGCNPPFEEYIGIRREDLVGKSVYDLSPKDLADKYSAADRQLFDNPVPQRYETQVQYADGSRHDVIFFKAPFFNQDGTVAGLIGAFLDITERKKAEEALRESEEKFRAFFTTSRDCVFITSPDGSWLDFNQAAVELFGYESRGELLKTRIPDLYADPGDRDNHTAFIRKNGYSFEYPVDLRKKDGTVIHTLITTAARMDFSGTIIGFQGSIRDITERRRAEEALIESEQRFRDIFNNTSDIVLLHEIRDNGPPGRFTDVNDVTCRLLGYTREELLTKTPLDITTDFHNPSVENILEEQRTTGGAKFETEYRAKDGTIIPVEINTRVVTLRGKKLMLGAARDITERKRAEVALRSSEARLHTLVRTIPDLIWLKDTEGVYLSCNPMFERFFGAKEPDIVGKTDYDFVGRELADFFREHDRRAMAAGKPTSNEEWITFADDGHRALLDTTKTPVHDARGTLIGVLGIGHDITGRKLAEEERERIRSWQSGVNRIMESILAPLPLDRKLKIITDGVVETFGADFCRIWLIDPG